jgi:hypothetical protein
VVNTGAETAYFGHSGVTSATGLPLADGGQVTIAFCRSDTRGVRRKRGESRNRRAVLKWTPAPSLSLSFTALAQR